MDNHSATVTIRRSEEVLVFFRQNGYSIVNGQALAFENRNIKDELVACSSPAKSGGVVGKFGRNQMVLPYNPVQFSGLLETGLGNGGSEGMRLGQ